MRARSLGVLLVAALGATAPATAAPRPAKAEPPPELRAALDSVAVFGALLSEQDPEPIEARARSCLAAVERRPGPDSIAVSPLVEFLVDLMVRTGETDSTDVRDLAERSVRIHEAHEGRSSPAVAARLYTLGLVDNTTGYGDEALAALRRALAICERAATPGDTLIVRVLNGIGNVLSTMDRYAEARDSYERAIGILERRGGRDTTSLARTFENLAIVFDLTGDWSAARPLYERSLAIFESAGARGRGEVAKVLSNYASMLADGGDYETARPMLERAYHAVADRPHPNPHGIAWTACQLGIDLMALGDTAQARVMFQKVEAIYARTLTTSSNPWAASLLVSYADLLRQERNFEESRRVLERSLAEFERTVAHDNPSQAEALRSRAELAAETGDDSLARALSERVVAMQEQVLGPDHPQMAGALSRLALALARTGEPRRALGAALRAETIGRDH